MDEKQLKPKSKTTFFILIGCSTAILLAAPVIILLFLGKFLDSMLNTGNAFLIGGLVIGFISGTMNVFRLMKLMQRRKEN